MVPTTYLGYSELCTHQIDTSIVSVSYSFPCPNVECVLMCLTNRPNISKGLDTLKTYPTFRAQHFHQS